MRVERQGQSLSLTWDRKSRPVINAQAATLSIRDGAQTRTISLDAMHLRSGSISYSPVASPVEFEMALIARNGSVSRDETIAVPLPVSAVQPVIAPSPPAEVSKQEARNSGAAPKPRWVPSAATSSAPAAKAPVTAQAGKAGAVFAVTRGKAGVRAPNHGSESRWPGVFPSKAGHPGGSGCAGESRTPNPWRDSGGRERLDRRQPGMSFKLRPRQTK